LLDANGTLHPQMLVFRGTRDARIHQEVSEHDDWFSRNTCQINAWTDGFNLLEWIFEIWYPIAKMKPGPKLLILDSYPLHVEFQRLFAKYETYVLYIPTGLTFALQPLDQGFHKVLKDELRKLWVQNQEREITNESESRHFLADEMKRIWMIMAEKDNEIYWHKAGLDYPDDHILFQLQRIEERMALEEADANEFENGEEMEIEHS